MNFDKYEWSSWSKIRERGKLMYMIQWIIFSFVFLLILQGILILVNKSSYEIQNFAPMLFASLVMGITISIVRWNLYEKRYLKNKE